MHQKVYIFLMILQKSEFFHFPIAKQASNYAKIAMVGNLNGDFQHVSLVRGY